VIDLERLYGRLQTQRVALDSKIVSVQITNAVLADRLEAQRPTLERLRSELVKLQERIPAPIDRKLSETRPSLKDSGSKPGDRDELPELDRLGGLASAAALFQRELGSIEDKLASVERDAESRKRMLADPKTDKARVAKLQETQAEGRLRNRELLDQANGTRACYVHAVNALREGLAQATQKPTESEAADSPARRELLQRVPPGSSRMPVPTLEGLRRSMEEFERTITTENVAVDLDRSIRWVPVEINGKPAQTMIVDPGADWIRLSARVAAELGVRPEEGESVVTMATADGRALPARRVSLDSVRVGRFQAAHVECLVLPADYGEAPSLLGGSFLNRFATKLELASETIALTQVVAKPSSRTGRTSGTKSSATSRGSRSKAEP
jgi:clan AA aspartic protease (TIGR02281 family)